MRLLPIDEINAISEVVRTDFEQDKQDRVRADYWEDIIEELLVMSYVYGTQDADEMLGLDNEPNYTKMNEAIYKKIAGEDFIERVAKYTESGTADDLIRVIETESHRVYNTGVYDTAEDGAKESGRRLMKRWETMLDDRVRDTHEPLQGVEIPFDDKFYTFDGDSARFPGEFSLPENNINCRCMLNVYYE